MTLGLFPDSGVNDIYSKLLDGEGIKQAAHDTTELDWQTKKTVSSMHYGPSSLI